VLRNDADGDVLSIESYVPGDSKRTKP